MIDPASRMQSFAIDALSVAAARVLALDPGMKAKLAPLEGRSVSLTLTRPPVRLLARVHDGSLRFALASHEDVTDLAVSTELGNLLQLGIGRISGAKQGLGIGKIHISGDAELARQVQQITDQFEPDWDAPIIALFGDVMGFQIARGARAALAFAQASAKRIAQASSEYLREESRDVVAAAELEQFYDDVDALRDQVARAEQRIAKLIA